MITGSVRFCVPRPRVLSRDRNGLPGSSPGSGRPIWPANRPPRSKIRRMLPGFEISQRGRALRTWGGGGGGGGGVLHRGGEPARGEPHGRGRRVALRGGGGGFGGQPPRRVLWRRASSSVGGGSPTPAISRGIG